MDEVDGKLSKFLQVSQYREVIGSHLRSVMNGRAGNKCVV